jgi:hypothetical protein
MTYLPLSRFRRNLATVIGNTGDAELAEVLEQSVGAARNSARSASTPVVEDAVAWAREKLAGR